MRRNFGNRELPQPMNMPAQPLAPSTQWPVLHPGQVLAEKLDELRIGFREFALRTGKPEKTIAAVLRGDSGIPAEMAVAFEFALGIPASYWLNHQRAFDEQRARNRKAEMLVDADSEWVQQFPLQEMRTIGWLEDGVGEAEGLLRFFGMASPACWRRYYVEGRLKVAFGMPLVERGAEEVGALSVWFRAGERWVEGLAGVEAMARPRFKRGEWRALLDEVAAAGEWERFVAGCRALGVVVCVVPALAPLAGDLLSTRWLQRGVPMIQVTRAVAADVRAQVGRLGHAVGHLALHGKKGIFLEDKVGRSADAEKEREADGFLRLGDDGK